LVDIIEERVPKMLLEEENKNKSFGNKTSPQSLAIYTWYILSKSTLLLDTKNSFFNELIMKYQLLNEIKEP
jgi:hypothetical protein